MWFMRFKQIIAGLLLPWLMALLIQSAGRLYLLLTYGSNDILSGFSSDIIKLFTTGLLFDIRIASLAYTPWLLIGCLLALHYSLFTLWQKSFAYFTTVLTLIITWMTVSNIYYYATYDRYIDLFIFGLIEDDTKAILLTLWNDYPIIRGVSLMILFAWGMFHFYRVWQNKLAQHRYKAQHYLLAIALTLAVFALAFLGMRGSIGTFPLRQSDTQISEVKLLNMLTPNGLIALDWAFKDYQRNNTFASATDEDGEKLLRTFFQRPMAASLSAFDAQTADNPIAKNKPPHVILTVMESLGEHLLTFDNSQRDLLGSLRPHWQQDWRFVRFLSEGDGTIDTLSRFFVRSPMSQISQSTAQFNDFKSNMFKPFLANGYKVIYITAGNGSWRNLNSFLPNLGVSEFIEQSTLKRLYPQAVENTWGVPDEYMFRYAQQRLEQAEQKGERLFIMMLSMTFHPPYKAPDNKDYQFLLSEAEKQRLSNFAQGNELNEVFNTFRYSNEQLGNFIGWIKNSQFSKKTIIAATGDHNVRGIGYPDSREQALGHAVPFYLYVPSDYQGNSYFDPSRVGSHKDIMPTLYQLSLSTTPYYQTGCNLLAKKQDPIWCAGYNPNVFITEQGAYYFNNKIEFAPWAGSTGLQLAEPIAPSEAQQKTYDHWQTFSQLLNWQLNRQVHQQN